MLALPERANSRANKAAKKKKWPPVEPGHKFIIYCPADLADYLQAECAALIKVNEDGSLVCCEVGCIKPDFGSSIKTRAPYNAALHLRSRHLVHMLRARATAAAAALVPKPKLAKAGAPVGSAAGAAARLGMALVPRDQVGATRLCEHAAAQAHNPPPPRPRRVFCGVVVAPSAAPGVFFLGQKKRLRPHPGWRVYLLTWTWCRHPIKRGALDQKWHFFFGRPILVRK